MANYRLNVAHLYGNLLNTYGDNGNLLMLRYVAEKMGVEFISEVVSIHEPFDPKKYDLVFFGGGQDFEQLIVSEDIQTKKESIDGIHRERWSHVGHLWRVSVVRSLLHGS